MQPNACSIKKLKDDMAPPQPSGGDEEPPRPKKNLPPEILEIIWPALQVGGVAGASGITIGAFAGVVRSSTPALFALASGVQWFTLGSTFWASRGFILHAWGKDKVTPREKVSASAIAGSIAGTAGGLLRGRGNIMPGALMFALFGATGQYIYNRADASQSQTSHAPSEAKDLKGSWLNSKWSPMKVLTDKEYEHMLQEKLLKVNAEIALVEESIEALRAQEKEYKSSKDLEPKGTEKSGVSKIL